MADNPKIPPMYERIRDGLVALTPDELMEQIANMVGNAFYAGMHTKTDDAAWWSEFKNHITKEDLKVSLYVKERGLKR
jgi:hypothetical protein